MPRVVGSNNILDNIRLKDFYNLYPIACCHFEVVWYIRRGKVSQRLIMFYYAVIIRCVVCMSLENGLII
jgi:hypothetical protein